MTNSEQRVERAANRMSIGLLPSVAMAAATGSLVGLAARASDYGPRAAAWVGALGAPWLLAAFANGALARRRRHAMIAGAVAIVVGVVAYYLSMWRLEQRTVEGYATAMIVGWSLAGVVIGAPFGLAGWHARFGSERSSAVAMAVLVAALLAEAAYGLLVWQNHYAQAIAALEVSAAIAIAVAFGRTKRVATLALPLSLALLACELAVTTLMRGAGWAGV